MHVRRTILQNECCLANQSIIFIQGPEHVSTAQELCASCAGLSFATRKEQLKIQDRYLKSSY